MQAMLPKWFTARRGGSLRRRSESSCATVTGKNLQCLALNLSNSGSASQPSAPLLKEFIPGWFPGSFLITAARPSAAARTGFVRQVARIDRRRSQASGTLGPATDVNLFSFTVQSGQRVAFDVDVPAGVRSTATCGVFDAAGHELAANDDARRRTRRRRASRTSSSPSRPAARTTSASPAAATRRTTPSPATATPPARSAPVGPTRCTRS